MTERRCDGCGGPGAHVCVRRTHGTDHREMWLCDTCSRELGVEQDVPAFGPTVTELLGSLVKDDSAVLCPGCGTRFREIRQSGRAGCAQCYRTFAAGIGRLLAQLGGVEPHVGRYPQRLASCKRIFVDRSVLKRELDAAVDREDYEEAAEIRDRMLSLEAGDDRA